MLTRRQTLSGAAAGVTVPALVACGAAEDDGDQGGQAGGDEGSRPPATPSGGLVSTADVPVGGGVILAEENLVVTQPSEGEFKGFSATCTHRGCQVGEVDEGSIVCPCHSSRFSIADGSVQEGQAEEPLDTVELVVDGDVIDYA